MTSHHSKESNWEEEFMMKFGVGHTDKDGTYIPNKDTIRLRDFIRSLLLSVAQETRGEVIEEIETAVNKMRRLHGAHINSLSGDSAFMLDFGGHEFVDTCDIFKALQRLLTSLTAPTE